MSFTARKSFGRFDVHSAKILLPEDSTVKCSCLCVFSLSNTPNICRHARAHTLMHMYTGYK